MCTGRDGVFVYKIMIYKQNSDVYSTLFSPPQCCLISQFQGEYKRGREFALGETGRDASYKFMNAAVLWTMCAHHRSEH